MEAGFQYNALHRLYSIYMDLSGFCICVYHVRAIIAL